MASVVVRRLFSSSSLISSSSFASFRLVSSPRPLVRFFSTSESEPKQEYQHILTKKEGKVGIVTLNRPKALNALCETLMVEVNAAMKKFDVDDDVGAIVLTGADRAFAAGADIKEMAPLTFMDVTRKNMFSFWSDITRIRKPIIAAVHGYALGGGCELAMMCDIIIAGASTKFGQPEIKLGTIPGVGGTQRLTRALGKAKAMDLILTGRQITAKEAEQAGLVSRVVEDKDVLSTAINVAETICSYSKPIVGMAKECVNQALETSLQEGVLFERKLFHSTFATTDQKEGMAAFIERRQPSFSDN